MAILLLIAGLALLVLSGDALVRGAVKIAMRLRIPPIIVGLTIVAFGTSAPELVVSLQAALQGAPDLAVGNVIGSNIFNATVVLGLPALFVPLSMAERGVKTSLIFMVVVAAFLMMESHGLTIDRWTGFRLLLLLGIYLVVSAYSARESRLKATEEVVDTRLNLPLAIALVVFGTIGLAVGGKLTTEGALGIAEQFGLAESAVGLTIVAIGTSLPELATSLVAAIRRHSGVAIGNVIGSNVFNVLGILGLTAVIVPLRVDPELVGVDMWIMFITSAGLIPLAFTTQRIGRPIGLVLVLFYLFYMVVALRHGMAG